MVVWTPCETVNLLQCMSPLFIYLKALGNTLGANSNLNFQRSTHMFI